LDFNGLQEFSSHTPFSFLLDPSFHGRKVPNTPEGCLKKENSCEPAKNRGKRGQQN
jgi:hypothetical protein